MLHPAHVQWQKNLLDALNIGGTWVIPANGAIITKSNPNTVQMVGPNDGMSAAVIRHCNAAGYNVNYTQTDVDPNYN